MHFFRNLALASCICFALTTAIPHPGLLATRAISVPNKLGKRTPPIIGEDIDIKDKFRGAKLVPRPDSKTSGAFAEAQQLLTYILFTPGVGIDSNSPIFGHHFNEGDRAKVKKVIAKLAGNPKKAEDVTVGGAKELGQITFQGRDTPNRDGDLGCAQAGTRMYTEYYETNGPVTVVCEDAWVYPDRDDLKCEDLGDRLKEDFAIVAHLVLHEYTHWDWFLKEITGGEVVDEHGSENACGYGLDNVYHRLDKKYAALNADSYAWYGTEVLWSVLCGKSYKEPGDDDSYSDAAKTYNISAE